MPEIIDAIEIILEHDTAGDPITGLKWTPKRPEKIAEVLQQIAIPVSANTVSRLLYQMDLSLRVNRKQIATNSSPYRDRQFQHISALRARFQRQGLPIISVDSKKREPIGNFKNGGVKWDRAAMTMLPSCWSWRTPAVATVADPGPGRPNFRLSCAIHLA